MLNKSIPKGMTISGAATLYAFLKASKRGFTLDALTQECQVTTNLYAKNPNSPPRYWLTPDETQNGNFDFIDLNPTEHFYYDSTR